MKEKSKKIPFDTPCIKGDGWSLDQSLSADKLSVKKRNVTTLRAKRDQNRE